MRENLSARAANPGERGSSNPSTTGGSVDARADLRSMAGLDRQLLAVSPEGNEGGYRIDVSKIGISDTTDKPKEEKPTTGYGFVQPTVDVFPPQLDDCKVDESRLWHIPIKGTIGIMIGGAPPAGQDRRQRSR